MKISENVVHQIAHFSSTAFIMMVAARRVAVVVVMASIVLGSAVKEFVFDRRTQVLQDRWEDFVFLGLGGVVGALVIIFLPLY